jgi:hypothetical protein
MFSIPIQEEVYFHGIKIKKYSKKVHFNLDSINNPLELPNGSYSK